MSLSEVKYPSIAINSFLFLAAIISGLIVTDFNFTEFINANGINYAYPIFYSVVGAFVFDTLFRSFGCYDTNIKRTFGVFLSMGFLWLIFKNVNEILPHDVSVSVKFLISIVGIFCYSILFQVAYEKQLRYLGVASSTLVIITGSFILLCLQVLINTIIQ